MITLARAMRRVSGPGYDGSIYRCARCWMTEPDAPGQEPETPLGVDAPPLAQSWTALATAHPSRSPNGPNRMNTKER